MAGPSAGSGTVRSAGSVTVRSPATCANLGPGFDSFGLAVDLHDDVAVELAPAGVEVEVAGEGAGSVPRGEAHLVVRALRATFDLLGVAQPGLRLRCTNRVPQGRGLGSSAAAIVSGVTAAQALAGAQGLGTSEALTLAASLEGHPDNVAACLLGGFTVAWRTGDAVCAVRLDVHPDISPVLFVPPTSLPTALARKALPAEVRHTDASFNAGRAGLLVAAMTRYPAELLAATDDRLHQPYRRALMPASIDLVDSLRAAGVAAALSGAGPAVLALSWPSDATGGFAPPGWRCLPLPVAASGAAVLPDLSERGRPIDR